MNPAAVRRGRRSDVRLVAAAPSLVTALAAISSGAAVALSFPSTDLGPLAWVALVPLLLVLRGASVGRAFLAGSLFGSAAGLGIYGWLFALPQFGLLHFTLLALYASLYPACWCVGVSLLSSRRGPGTTILVAPALWVALDLLRSHAGFLALPWATLGQSQHDNLPALQVAALGGEGAVTFLVVMANMAIASLLADRSSRGARLALATIVAAHVGGAIVLATPEVEPTLEVAAVQPAIGLAERDSTTGRAAIWDRLEALTREAMVTGESPALVVWPETAVGDPRHNASLAARLGALSASVGMPIVAGAAETEKFAAAANDGLSTVERDAWNSAYLVAGGAVVGDPYRKRVLMPFGEYLPLRGTLDWSWLGVPDVADGQAGDGDAAFDIPGASAGPIRVATTICWESEFAALTRRSVADGARVMVQLTNDAWFGDTRAAAQHNMASVMRAVENRVPVVLASNTGPSQVIDSHGRIAARVEGHGRRGVASASVPLGAAGGTVYTRVGEAFSFACIAFVVACLAGAPGSMRRRAPARPFLPTPYAKEAT